MDFRPYGPGPVLKTRKKHKHLAPQFTAEQIQEFDRKNWENYIHYFRTELKKMLNGTPPLEVFSKRDCQLLGKRGVIIRRNLRYSGVRWIVSPRAIETLKSL